MTKALFFSAFIAAALSACASKAPPAISFDADDFDAAAVLPEPANPVKIVTVPQPLPLPGQLKPLEGAGPVSDPSGHPIGDVDEAHDAARVEPQAKGFVNAIQHYPYAEGALYRVYSAPEQVTDIALQRGEGLISVSAGDTVRWVIGDTVSGSGADERVHILAKPYASGLVTNMVINTDRRTYHLELRSLETTYMASVSWHYPHDALVALTRSNDKAVEARSVDVATGLNLNHLRFRYTVSGDTPPWRPLRAFDDGRKVYIQFPRRLDQGEAPPLFVVNEKGATQLVNYRVRQSFYIVDRLFAAAELRLGEDPQTIVRITRTDGQE